MMKKTTVQTLLPVFSILLLLVSVTVSASAQGYFVEGKIRWNKEMGVVPAGTGQTRAAASPCQIFSVAALDAKTQKPVVYTDQVSSPFRKSEEEGYYVCRYSLKVPPDRSLYMIATMGGVLLLPEEDRYPLYITEPWLGGNSSKPRAGYERAFTGQKYVMMRSRNTNKKVVWRVDFEMIYLRNHPN